MSKLAKKIYENQLRIEAVQRAPFQQRPLIEPQIPAEVRAKFSKSNPFYKLENIDIMGEVEIAKFLDRAGITMPVGVSPYSAEGQAHIKTQIKSLSDISGIKMDTVVDLLKIMENPDKNLLNAVNEIGQNSNSLLNNISVNITDFKTTLQTFLDEEADKIERKKQLKSGLIFDDDEEEKAPAFIPTADKVQGFTSQELNDKSKDELYQYVRSTLNLQGHSRKNKGELINIILSVQNDRAFGSN